MTALTVPSPILLPLATVALAGMLAAACAPVATSPQQMQSSLPSVTYRYSADQDLVQANQSAAAYCAPYQGTPRAKLFSTDPDGGRRVVFECVHIAAAPLPMPQPIPSQPYTPNFSYTVASDQDLLNAARNAQAYCLSNGAERVVSTIGTSETGLRTVSFQCQPQ